MGSAVARSGGRWEPEAGDATRGSSSTGARSLMRQYEIRWATLPDHIGRRPVLLLSRTPAYSYLAKVIVAPITTRVRGIPQEVVLSAREGLDRPSVASFDNVQVIPLTALDEAMGLLAESRHVEVKR